MAVMKRVLRKRMKTAAKCLCALEIQRQSEEIARRVMELPEFKRSNTLSVYLHMPTEEATTRKLLQASFEGGKKVYVPKIVGKHADDMKMIHALSLEDIDAFPRDKWQIPDPPLTTSPVGKSRDEAITSLDLDLVLLPGVAFDPMGGRLGHGKGYYDSFLSRLKAQYLQADKLLFTTVGICLAHQLIDAVPRSPHDIPLDIIVTPTSVLRSSS